MSERYEVIAGLLSDPGNRLIAEREILRQDIENRMIVPPLQKKLGDWYFLTPNSYVSKDTALHFEEVLLSLVRDPTGYWSVQFYGHHDANVIPHHTNLGPFNTQVEALDEVFRLFEELKWVYLKEDPWDKKDLKEFA